MKDIKKNVNVKINANALNENHNAIENYDRSNN